MMAARFRAGSHAARAMYCVESVGKLCRQLVGLTRPWTEERVELHVAGNTSAFMSHIRRSAVCLPTVRPRTGSPCAHHPVLNRRSRAKPDPYADVVSAS